MFMEHFPKSYRLWIRRDKVRSTTEVWRLIAPLSPFKRYNPRTTALLDGVNWMKWFEFSVKERIKLSENFTKLPKPICYHQSSGRSLVPRSPTVNQLGARQNNAGDGREGGSRKMKMRPVCLKHVQGWCVIRDMFFLVCYLIYLFWNYRPNFYCYGNWETQFFHYCVVDARFSPLVRVRSGEECGIRVWQTSAMIKFGDAVSHVSIETNCPEENRHSSKKKKNLM